MPNKLTSQGKHTLIIKKQAQRQLCVTGGQDMLAVALLHQHNQDQSAHPNLWYVHEQGEANEVWTITHNLDRHPSVTVVDSGDNVVIGYVTYLDNNNLEVKFNGAFKGKAYLN